MGPGLSVHNEVHGHNADCESLCQRVLGVFTAGVQTSNLKNLSLNELCSTLLRACRLSISAHHVRNVVGMCSGFEMIGSAARGVVARVTDHDSVIEESLGELEGDTMGKKSPATHIEPSVALWILRSRPIPAPVLGLLHFAPESILKS